MKRLLYVLFLLFGISATTLSQTADLNRRINVDYKKQSLHSILNDLQGRFGVNLSYTNSHLPLNQKITIKADNEAIIDFLKRLLLPFKIECIPIGGKLILKQADPPKNQDPSPKQKQEKPLMQNIRGIVINKDTRLPLEGASVVIRTAGNNRMTITDSSGVFRFPDAPIGRWEIEVSMAGYQKALLPALLINSGKEGVFTIELNESEEVLENVTVQHHRDRQKASNEMATVSARSFTVEETSRYAASISDPARMALAYAGVASTNDLGNELIIRGNSPKGVLWQLEGIEIINPNHFMDEGSSGGGVSMISSSMLANSDFYTGAFPAEFGNALSGVFDLKFRKGNTERNEYSVMAGFIGTAFSAEGPFKKGKQGSYLVNYRYSTLALLEKMGLNPVNEGIVPEYQDLSYNINLPTKSIGTFSFFGIGGLSRQLKHAKRDYKKWGNYWDKIDADFRYRTLSTGAKHVFNFKNNGYLQSIISFSGSYITEDMDSLNALYEKFQISRDKYYNSSIRIATKANIKLTGNSLLRSGIIYNKYHFNLNSLTVRRSQGIPINHLNDAGNTSLVQGFIQLKHRINNNLFVTSGFHSSYFLLNKEKTIEPRLGLEWKLPKRQFINFGAGLHSRIEPLVIYFGRNRLPDGTITANNPHLKLTKSLHIITGYSLRLSDYIKFKTELYYQHLFDVPMVDDPTVAVTSLNSTSGFLIYEYNFRELTNKGKGRNYGIEVSVERSFNKGYYFMLNSSVFESKFTAANGKEFNTRFNSNYINNFVFGKEYKTGNASRNVLGVNSKVIWSGGQRYTPIDEEASIISGENVFILDKTFSRKMRDYFRSDISFSYRINRERKSHVFSLDIQNIFDRRNINGYIFDTDSKTTHTVYNAGIIPIVNYKIEF